MAFFATIIGLLMPLIDLDFLQTLTLFALFLSLLTALLPLLTASLLLARLSCLSTSSTLTLVLFLGQLPATLVEVRTALFMGAFATGLILLHGLFH